MCARARVGDSGKAHALFANMRTRTRWSLLVATLAAAMPAAAQLPSAAPQQNAWVSVGFGTGSPEDGSSLLAGVASAWYSNGPFVGGIRTAAVSGLFSNTGAEDVAGLIGLRTSGRRAFLVGALGYSAARRNRGCAANCANVPGEERVSALAYSAQANANFKVIGLGIEVFGAENRGDARFIGTAITLQLGWFGQ